MNEDKRQILNERWQPLLDAIEEATQCRPSISTARRWVHAGTKGARLEAVVVGGCLLTSVQAVKRFVVAASDARGMAVTQAEVSQ